MRWAEEGTIHPRFCHGKKREILHHDHLIDEAKARLHIHIDKKIGMLISNSDKNKLFQRLWVPFLEDNRGLFFIPIMVCKTCNEQDGLLKNHGGKGEIPKGMSLDGTFLKILATIKISVHKQLGRKASADAVRKAYLPYAKVEELAYRLRLRKLDNAIKSLV